MQLPNHALKRPQRDASDLSAEELKKFTPHLEEYLDLKDWALERPRGRGRPRGSANSRRNLRRGGKWKAMNLKVGAFM